MGHPSPTRPPHTVRGRDRWPSTPPRTADRWSSPRHRGSTHRTRGGNSTRMADPGPAQRSSPAPRLLVGLTLLTVPALVVAFLAELREAAGPVIGLPVIVFPAAALVAGPLALALFAASAIELRRQRRERAALLRTHETTLGELAAIVETADDA